MSDRDSLYDVTDNLSDGAHPATLPPPNYTGEPAPIGLPVNREPGYTIDRTDQPSPAMDAVAEPLAIRNPIGLIGNVPFGGEVVASYQVTLNFGETAELGNPAGRPGVMEILIMAINAVSQVEVLPSGGAAISPGWIVSLGTNGQSVFRLPLRSCQIRNPEAGQTRTYGVLVIGYVAGQ